MKLIKLLLSTSIAATALIGDYTVFRSKFSESFVFRAFADSFVHASIGCLSALSFFSYQIHYTHQELLCNVIICTLLSSLIDIDHFLVAQSLKLKDLQNLNRRGVFHCTTLWTIILAILISISILTKNSSLYLLSFMLLLAVTSHHIRDGNRRGLWLFPFGSTPPINQYFYIFLSMFIPYLVAVLFKMTRHFVKSDLESDLLANVIII